MPKWCNFDNTQKNFTTFAGVLGENKKMIRGKMLLKKFKQRSSKLDKSFSRDLVKQTVDWKANGSGRLCVRSFQSMTNIVNCSHLTSLFTVRTYCGVFV